jgi:hypothetical protein
LIRIAFIILTILTGGIWVVAYIVMSFIIPQANTPEEMAQATGASKITAQELIDNARKSYHEFKDKEEWKQWRRNMKEQAKQWKYQWKKEAKIQKYNYKYNQCDHNYYHHRCHKKGLLHSIWDLFWMLVLVYAVWYGYHNFASVHQFLDAIVALYNRGIDWLAVNVH